MRRATSVSAALALGCLLHVRSTRADEGPRDGAVAEALGGIRGLVANANARSSIEGHPHFKVFVEHIDRLAERRPASGAGERGVWQRRGSELVKDAHGALHGSFVVGQGGDFTEFMVTDLDARTGTGNVGVRVFHGGFISWSGMLDVPRPGLFRSRTASFRYENDYPTSGPHDPHKIVPFKVSSRAKSLRARASLRRGKAATGRKIAPARHTPRAGR